MQYPSAYKGDEPYIFISYAHSDSDTVLPIIKYLIDTGYRVWYDAGIEAGTEWREYIARRLNGCACMIAFLSENAINSKNCKREIDFAFELDKDVLAVYLEELNLSLGMRMQLNSFQALHRNRHTDEQSFLDALCESELLSRCISSPPNMKNDQVDTSAGEDIIEKVWNIHTVWNPMDEPDFANYYIEACEVYCNEPDHLEESARSTLETFAEGLFLFYNHDYTAAYENFKKASLGLFPPAMSWVARCAEKGFGRDKNDGFSLLWDRFAAYNNDPYGTYRYAFRFLEDDDQMPNDYKKYISILRRAAELGSPDAMFKLGTLYVDGNFEPENLSQNVQAQEWYNKAFAAYLNIADLDPEAQYRIGLCYLLGAGVKKNVETGKMWQARARENGFANEWVI